MFCIIASLDWFDGFGWVGCFRLLVFGLLAVCYFVGFEFGFGLIWTIVWNYDCGGLNLCFICDFGLLFGFDWILIGLVR